MNPAGSATPAGRAWASLFVLGLLYVLSFLDRLILVLLVEPLKRDLMIDDVQIGLLIGTSFALVYSIAGLPLARLADTRDRPWLICAGATVWGLSTAAAAFAQTYPQLLVLRLGVAVGEAALAPAAMSLLSDMFPPNRRALPISIFVTVGVCGASGAMIAGAMVIDFAGELADAVPFLQGMASWRVTLIAVGLPAIAVALLVPLVVPRALVRSAAGEGGSGWGAIRSHVAGNSRTYIGFWGLTALVSAINYSILTWFPTHLIRSYDIGAAEAGYAFGLLGLPASLVGGTFLAWLARRLARGGKLEGPLLIAAGVSLLSTPLLAFALAAPSRDLALGLMVLPMILQMGMGILLATSSALLAPGGIRSQMVAIYYLVLSLAGLGIGPPLVAALAKGMPPLDGNISLALGLAVLVAAPLQIGLVVYAAKAFARTQAQTLTSDAANVAV